MDLEKLLKALDDSSKSGDVEAELGKLSRSGAIQVIDLPPLRQETNLLKNKKTQDDVEPSTLEDHFPPSSANLATLTLSEYKDLDSGQRHTGTTILLRINKITFGAGIEIGASDTSGAECRVWSFIRQPCGQSSGVMTMGAWIAIKEPFLGKSPDGIDCIRLDHPTDAVMVSRFGAHRKLFPTIEGQTVTGDDVVPYLQAGNNAFLEGRNFEAVECYTQAIQHTLSFPDTTDMSKLADLYIKNAFANTRCRNFTTAAEAAKDAFAIDRNSLPALRLLCSAKAAVEDWQPARELANSILSLDPDSKSAQNNHERMRGLNWQHRAGGYDFGPMVAAAQKGDGIVGVASFTGEIVKRRSPLGGNGMFAKNQIRAGELLLVEKPFALALPSDCTTTIGFKDLLPGETTSPRKLALLEKLVDRVVSDPSCARSLFELWDGEGPDARSDGEKSEAVFDSYRTLRIINLNAHTVFPGPLSRMHAAFSPSTPEADRASCSWNPDSARLGLWLKASLFNHSCVPNASWSWIGDALVVRANHSIAKGEEVTTSYCDPTLQVTKKQQELENSYGFSCRCPLCLADSSVSSEDLALRNTLDKITRQHTRDTTALRPAIAKTIATFYPSRTYLRLGLPCPALASPFLLLAHQTLGPVSTWASAPPASLALATRALYSCLSLGLGVQVSFHTGRIFGARHAQARGVGVWALVGLAELAFLDPRDSRVKDRCRILKAGAKSMYRVVYGEDGSFGEKGREYKCWGVEAGKDGEGTLGERGEDREMTMEGVGMMWEEWEEEGAREAS